jgi:quercetin dioxygenase-like cupin family protein
MEVYMAVIDHDTLKLAAVEMEGVRKASKVNVIGPVEGWQDHVLRLFRIEAGGNTPHHQHDYEHVNYITKGKGTLTIEGETREVKQGDFAFVPPNAMHQFKNPFDTDFEFICIVPTRGA